MCSIRAATGGVANSTLAQRGDGFIPTHQREISTPSVLADETRTSAEPNHALQPPLQARNDFLAHHRSPQADSRRALDCINYGTEAQSIADAAEARRSSDSAWADDWWSSSFTAAGYEELAVLEPMMLFSGNWDGLQ